MEKREGLARTLGCLSLGLGAAQVLAPGRVARAVGLDDDAGRTWVRLIGMREVASGIGLLAEPRSDAWLRLRAAGDAMDVALLALALTSRDTSRDRTLCAVGAVAGIALLDLYGTTRDAGGIDPRAGAAWRERAIDVTQSITINRPAAEIYRFWRDLENLPGVMRHLESVEPLGNGRYRWQAHAPAGVTVGWDAEIVDDRPDERIAWRSLPGSQVDNEGSVEFRTASGGRGTEVRVRLLYRPPGGRLGAAVARLFGEAPAQQVRDDLRVAKQVLEIGEVVHSDASIHAKAHPARPSGRTRGRLAEAVR